MFKGKMDTPLMTWYCDQCGEQVSKENGYVIWDHDKEGFYYNFRIIHQNKCDDNDLDNSQSLAFFLGSSGLAHLLEFFSFGSLKNGSNCAKDIHEYIDFICRVQLPYYEQARRYFQTEIGQTILRNGWPTEAELKKIIADNID